MLCHASLKSSQVKSSQVKSSQVCYKSLLAFSAVFPCLAHSQSLIQVGFATGMLQQDYQELSASAPNGIFNQETGNLNTWQIQANYLPTLSISKLNLPLYVQVQYSQSMGNTQYDGFLQQGKILIPFMSKTNNHLQDVQFSIGLPFTHQSFQLTPLVSYSYHTWQRDLSQYQETYHHQAVALGLLAVWQINPQWQMTSQFSAGQMQSAQLNVPHVQFIASLGTQTIKTAHAQLAYDVNPYWQLALSANYQHYRYGQSAVNNGLFAPESITKQRSLLASLNYTY